MYSTAKRANVEAAAQGDFNQRRVVDAGTGELGPSQRRRKRRRIDRAAQALPQIRQSADVIFMAVGQEYPR